MKIGVLTTSYPRGPEDPAGVFVRDRVLRLRAEGAEVEVLAAGPASCPERTADGLAVVRVAAGPTLLAAGAPEGLEARGLRAWIEAAGFSAALAANTRARVDQWDAVESHWLVPSALVATTVAPGRPHQAWAHGGDVALLERLIAGDALARSIARTATELVFVSADLRARFERLCGHPAPRARVEPVAVDAAVFRPRAGERKSVRRRLGVHGPLVLGVGRLVPIKGFDLLVRAVARLPYRCRLVIAGAGPERALLQRLAADRRMDLLLTGPLARADVADWMTAADVYAHPARVLASGRTEGMPVATREALAAGLTVVASASGGLRELAPSPTLAFIPPGDLAALTFALQRVLDAHAVTHLGPSGCEDGVPHRP